MSSDNFTADLVAVCLAQTSLSFGIHTNCDTRGDSIACSAVDAWGLEFCKRPVQAIDIKLTICGPTQSDRPSLALQPEQPDPDSCTSSTNPR